MNPIQHGRSAYANGKCRCETCRAANTEYQNSIRKRLRDAPVPASVHGTRNGYIQYSCRCADCTAVHSEYCRRYQQSIRAQRRAG